MTLIILLTLWLMPVITAFGRGVHWRTVLSIAVLDVVLGWTIIVWVYAMIWSLEAPRDHVRS